MDLQLLKKSFKMKLGWRLCPDVRVEIGGERWRSMEVGHTLSPQGGRAGRGASFTQDLTKWSFSTGEFSALWHHTLITNTRGLVYRDRVSDEVDYFSITAWPGLCHWNYSAATLQPINFRDRNHQGPVDTISSRYLSDNTICIAIL